MADWDDVKDKAEEAKDEAGDMAEKADDEVNKMQGRAEQAAEDEDDSDQS